MFCENGWDFLGHTFQALSAQSCLLPLFPLGVDPHIIKCEDFITQISSQTLLQRTQLSIMKTMILIYFQIFFIHGESSMKINLNFVSLGWRNSPGPWKQDPFCLFLFQDPLLLASLQCQGTYTCSPSTENTVCWSNNSLLLIRFKGEIKKCKPTQCLEQELLVSCSWLVLCHFQEPSKTAKTWP